MATAPVLRKSLGDIRRKAVDLTNFNPVKESLLQPDQPLPLILEPAAEQVDLADWARSKRDYIAEKQAIHGGILFRGFGLKNAGDHERVASAICGDLFADYGDLPKEGAATKVYTSTPYPNDKSILYHNESSHMSSWPSKINFMSIKVAEQGGCTPIVDCRKVYADLDPEVREMFETKGVTYVRNFAEGLDVSWQRFFSTDDRAVVEESCSNAGMTCEWYGQDFLRLRQKCRAVIKHPRTGEKIFFNQVQLHHIHCVDEETRTAMLSIFKEDELPRHVYFGDMTPIPDSVMDHVGEVYERNAIRFQWQEGDLVALDNMLVAHARDPYVGHRKVVVALGDMVYDKDVA